jgi:hypothetical protein
MSGEVTSAGGGSRSTAQFVIVTANRSEKATGTPSARVTAKAMPM